MQIFLIRKWKRIIAHSTLHTVLNKKMIQDWNSVVVKRLCCCQRIQWPFNIGWPLTIVLSHNTHNDLITNSKLFETLLKINNDHHHLLWPKSTAKEFIYLKTGDGIRHTKPKLFHSANRIRNKLAHFWFLIPFSIDWNNIIRFSYFFFLVSFVCPFIR